MTTFTSPLHDVHSELNARFVPFAGWNMPIQYSSIIEEHLAVREKAGVFDTTHMGEIKVSGKGAFDFIQRLITNDLTKIQPNQCIYSPMLRKDGNTIDDLIVNWISDQEFILVINASNKNKDLEWITEQAKTEKEALIIEDISESLVMLAVQGPKSIEIVSQIFDKEPPKAFHLGQFTYEGQPILIMGTGYTGEKGVELLIPLKAAEQLFKAILSAGAKPCGLGARDSLRLEKGYCLYGHELNEDITPLEAGLNWTIGWNKSFIGKTSLEKQREAGHRLLVGFMTEGRVIAREGCPTFYENKEIGKVTSGTFSPSLKRGIGLAMVDKKHSIMEVEIRGKKHRIKTHPRVFVK